MKPLIPAILVFLLIVFSGVGILLLKNGAGKNVPPSPRVPAREPVRGMLPPLKLPDEKKNAPGSDGWEYEGEIGSNFVSAKTRFTAELLYRGWKPDKQITLDETLSPRVLLTFQQDSLELVLMLWKIDTVTTGFSYKREKIVNPGVSVQ